MNREERKLLSFMRNKTDDVRMHTYKIIEPDVSIIHELEHMLYRVASDNIVQFVKGEDTDIYYLESKEITESELNRLYYELRRQYANQRTLPQKTPITEEVYNNITVDNK